MKRIAAIIGIIAVLAAGFLLLGNSRSAEGPAQSGGVTAVTPANKSAAPPDPESVPVLAAEVAVREMRQVLDVNGSLKTDEDVHIGTRIAGKVVRVTVKEGDRVERGQVLVQLDERELRAQIARARGSLAAAAAKLSLSRNQANWKDTSARSDHERAVANLAVAKARVQQALTSAKLIDVETRKRVETAESGVKVATERLSIVRDVTRKQELRQAQLVVDQTKAQLGQARVDMENARRLFEHRQMLFRQDAIAKEEADEAERRYKAMQASERVAASAVIVAEERLDLAKEGSRPEEVRIAEGQLAAANRALEQAQSDERRREVAEDEVAAVRASQQQAEAAVRSTEAGLVQTQLSQDDINSAEAAVAQAKADISFYRTQLSDLTIRAPVSGVVSTRQVHVGEMVTTSSPLIGLVALDTVYCEAQVPELEIGLLREGMPAQVTVDALPGRKFAGAVREIIPVADRTSKSFRVRIAVLGGKGTLPAGGYARASILVGRHPGALVVSRDAVRTESGDSFVWLVATNDRGGATAVRRGVKVGLVDDRYAEVLTGLRRGQKVVAAGSPAIIDGTPITVTGDWKGL